MSEKTIISRADLPSPLPLELFWTDHWSLLLYIESQNVDGDGTLAREKLNSKERANWKPEYGTRLPDGRIMGDSDDKDALADLVRENFIVREGVFVRLTDLGWTAAHALRKNRGQGKSDRDFNIASLMTGEEQS
jgi:hypothetical protein